MLGEERGKGPSAQSRAPPHAQGSQGLPSPSPGRSCLRPTPTGPFLSELTDLCSQGGSISREMWDPVPHHPREWPSSYSLGVMTTPTQAQVKSLNF